MKYEPGNLRSVATARVPDQFVEPPPFGHPELRERARIVAYLRAEAPSSSCRLAMMHVADQIERGAHIKGDGQ